MAYFISSNDGGYYEGDRLNDADSEIQARRPSQEYSWSGAEWVLDADRANQVAEDNRQIAYRNESDPLFFKWQRGEATENDWLSKVIEIRSRYPKTGESQINNTENYKALVRRRAAELTDQGNTTEALLLLATIGE